MSSPENIVIVGGCGHVGLPLGIAFARSGCTVTLLDIDAPSIESVNSGRMPFMERGAQAALTAVIGKTLTAASNPECLRHASTVVTILGTPVDRHLNPTVRNLYKSLDDLLQYIADGTLLVLRSTVTPGVTNLVHQRIRSLGRNIDVVFCPERLAEGNALDELSKLPQIVGAFDAKAFSRASELFRAISPSIIELTPLEAELAKLFTNSWRYLVFAASNQFYMLAESCGLDFYRIYDAMTRDYPRLRSFASAGFAAGPCLLKDTLQLSAFASNNFFLGHAAMLINEGLPDFIVNQLRSGDLTTKTVGILGMAFKSESDDKRESLSYKLKNLLEFEAKRVLCTDPYVRDPSLVSLEQAIEDADIVIVGAPHKLYRDLKIPSDKTVVDIWNIWPVRRKNLPDEIATAAGVSTR